MSSSLSSLLLSPYHLVSSDSEDVAVQQLEKQLLFATGKGMPFSLVAESMERAYDTSNQAIKHNTAVALTQEALQAQDSFALQLYTVLRLCLPLYDNRSVYGFKTHRLLKSFAKALEKSGGISGKSASAQILAWLKSPVPVKRGDTLICAPEIAVAHAHALCFPQTIHPGKRRTLTIGDIGALCQRLTNMYKEKHKDLVLATGTESADKTLTGIKVDKIAEVLTAVLPNLDYTECKALVRLLLRSITMGIGVKTFTGALGPGWESYLDYQMDLGRLAMDYCTKEERKSPAQFLCGVPFRAMTCEVVSSPYVMKWLFGKEENIKTYLPPKDGRLIMHSNGKWYVPLKRSTSAMRRRFVDLESNSVLESKYTQKHMKVLQHIKKNQDLFFNVKVAQGMIITYMLSDSEQDKNSHIFLLRGMKPLERGEIEFMDVEVDYDEAVTTKKKMKADEWISALVISPDTPRELPTLMSQNMTVLVTTTAPSSAKNDTDKGMIVQRKYDGDRMQAHIALDSNARVKVRLFSKRGKPVEHLYTDVARELENKISVDMRLAHKELPCILDGEIIVVNSGDQTPLPWSSTKWRYDSGREGMPLESAVGEGAVKGMIASIITSRKYGENLEDGEEAPISCATLGALKAWDQLGSNEKRKIKVKVIESARLLYVIFDIILLKGKNISNLSYVDRLSQLKKMSLLSNLVYSIPIKESYHIQNAQQLVKELTKAVQTKAEGLILKDPRAKYVFGKTKAQRKLKICGPDINCAVVGLGFTMSKNPRMWGILSAIFSENKREFWVYNRVESIEGDSPSRAAEHILSLSSLVLMDALMSPPKEVDTSKYMVTSQIGDDDDVVRVSWIPKDRALADYECTIVFMSGLPQDIQWLCNPLECTFGLSQRGDLYPIDWDLPGGRGEAMHVPRFPVARIQLDDHQRSECDTPSSIKEKFQQAALESTCIQEYFNRRVRQLRTKPPKQNKLEELRRILLGKEFQTEMWPQKLDAMYRLDEFSDLLIKNGFEPLTQGERHVLCGGRNSSQWDPMFTKKIQILASEDMMAAQEEREAALPFLSNALRRLKALKSSGKLRPPITAANSAASTALMSSPSITIPMQEIKMVFTLPDHLPYADISDNDNESATSDEEGTLTTLEYEESTALSQEESIHYHDQDVWCEHAQHDAYHLQGYNDYYDEDGLGCAPMPPPPLFQPF